MTTTPKRLLRALDARDGRRCAWHGRSCGEDTLVPQHRGNRGMGGRPSAMVLPNLVWLCASFNGLIETSDRFAEHAHHLGIKISSFDDPEQVPVRYTDGWYLLTGIERTPLRADEAAELCALYGMGVAS